MTFIDRKIFTIRVAQSLEMTQRIYFVLKTIRDSMSPVILSTLETGVSRT